jgi:ParB family chromosome partitioning protein
MTEPTISLVPIAEIRVVNPRTRNRITFQSIRANIASVGLKKPITLRQRAPDADGTRYDLVCGQGRLESVRDLGDTEISAIITNAAEEECYLMSLVENLARRQPSTTELVREVKRLISENETSSSIAEKLGMDRSYINGITNLLRRGEEDLIARVEEGRLPIDTAIKIASGKDVDIQRALAEAYENGTLRGAKLHAVQQLIARRKGTKPAAKNHTTGADLVRAYEHHTLQQRALVRRSTIITQRLAVLTSSLRRVLADDHFVTLLRAEGLRTMPDFLTAGGKEQTCQ